jgi:hypothetical protein
MLFLSTIHGLRATVPPVQGTQPQSGGSCLLKIRLGVAEYRGKQLPSRSLKVTAVTGRRQLGTGSMLLRQKLSASEPETALLLIELKKAGRSLAPTHDGSVAR